MNPGPRNCSDIARLIKLVRDRSIGMLTCLDYGGALVSKPITPLKIDSNGAIWFFIDLYAGRVGHLRIANLSFTEMHSETYISLSGCGEVNRSQTHIESLWSDSAKACFPDGPKSINLALLKFSPYAAECWDVTENKMVSVYNMLTSVVPSVSIGRNPSTKINIETINNLNCSQTIVANNL